MNELHSKPETTDIKNREIENSREIKLESDMSVKEAQSFIANLFDVLFDRNNGYFTSPEARWGRTPTEERASWIKERGDSKCIPKTDTDSGISAKEKLAEYGLDGIEYKKGEPDFSPCAEVTIKIDGMTENRDDYRDKDGNLQQGNFSQADIKCAEQFNAEQKNGKADWTPRDVKDWRQENKYSWHECCDTKTMQLVPYEIHSYFSHSGGVAECKARDNNTGGGFDE
jgi:hypothetical protein